jgi:hypothetical protein
MGYWKILAVSPAAHNGFVYCRMQIMRGGQNGFPSARTVLNEAFLPGEVRGLASANVGGVKDNTARTAARQNNVFFTMKLLVEAEVAP